MNTGKPNFDTRLACAVRRKNICLLRMIHDACMDELQQRKRYPYHSLEPRDMDGESVKASQWALDARQTPEETFIQHEAWGSNEHYLQRLPVAMREVVILIDIEGLDYTETTHISGIPLGTVKNRLGRARARLRDILSEVRLH